MVYKTLLGKALFVDDVDGGTIIECSSCESKFIITELPCECVWCGALLEYPEGASW